MKIEVHSLLHNEAPLIPYFIRHYGQFASIIFYESDSTDDSVLIAESLGAKVKKLDTGNLINEYVFLKMKNHCWKDSTADWVIIVDTDEFVYHPDIVSVLSKTEYTAFYPKEYRMYSREFPKNKGQIYDAVKLGVPGVNGFNKLNIFRPDSIKEMNYGPGCHSCAPEGDVKICYNTNIKTLHYHDVGLDYRLAKNKYIAARVSDENKKRDWGFHVFKNKKTITAEFEASLAKAKPVI